MRLVVTGGGTGGHVYPALEVALGAQRREWDVQYFGSFRGQEGDACQRVGLRFTAFASEPVYSLKTFRGLRALVRLYQASLQAGKALRREGAEAVFATGGYSSAPILRAAQRLGIPTVLHEQNAVPGRTQQLMSKGAAAVCTVFAEAESHFPGARVVRTGMPVRKALRDSAQGRLFEEGISHSAPVVLVMGGSQGSAALNDVALTCAARMARSEVQWIHVTGPKHYEETLASSNKLAIKSDYSVRPYLQEDDLAAALFSCAVCVSRAGAGTLAELAAFRKPSILVPFPSAFGDHQTRNATEFVEMGAADLIPQDELTPAGLEVRILKWLSDENAARHAREALAQWDRPDATELVLNEIQKAVKA